MPPRRGQAQKPDLEVDNMFSLSQQSTSSDDGMMAALEEKMKMATEKRKIEKGRKFIQASKKEFQEMGAQTRAAFEETKAALHDMDVTFAKFVSDYATLEDEIRTAWLLIGKEQETMLDLAERHLLANTEGAKKTEKAHLKGMAQTRKACEDMTRIVDSITSMTSGGS